MPAPQITVNVQSAALGKPRWSEAKASPGQDIGLEVTATDIEADQSVWFAVRRGDVLLAMLPAEADGDTHKATWTVLNTGGPAMLAFDALLRQKPTPANGHRTVAKSRTSSELEVSGFAVEILDIDEAFVPGPRTGDLHNVDALNVKYQVTNPGNIALVGRIEVWGEKYPTDAPLFTRPFVPEPGEATWGDWDGKADTGEVLSGRYITPEFTPYRVRIVIGVDEAALGAPDAIADGKASAAEAAFEVTFEGVELAIQSDIEPDVRAALERALAIEPQRNDGAFAAQGRLPAHGEAGRIRIDCVRFLRIGEALQQGGDQVGDRYMGSNDQPMGPAIGTGAGIGAIIGALAGLIAGIIGAAAWGELRDALARGGQLNEAQIAIILSALGMIGGAALGSGVGALLGLIPASLGRTKFDIDKDIYSRPELPVEIIPYLKGKGGARAPFVAEPVGEPRFELRTTCVRDPKLFSHTSATTAPSPAPTLNASHRALPAAFYNTAQETEYFANAASCVKDGLHDAPVHDPATSTPVIAYWQHRHEVTLPAPPPSPPSPYSIATPRAFTVGAGELTVYLDRARLAVGVDYDEVSDTEIRLKAELPVATGAVVWIVRVPSVEPVKKVHGWVSFPPGDNCHAHYGGIRGSARNPELLDRFSIRHSGREPILGKGTGDFPYAKRVDLDPDQAKDDRERVSARADGSRGKAGFIFSPSTIGGDSYTVEARLTSGYDRTLGYLGAAPWVRGRTGTMTVWRLCTIGRSLRQQTPAGYDPGVASRAYVGDGRSMRISEMNRDVQGAFNEWVLDGAVPGTSTDPHEDIRDADYAAAHNEASGKFAGAGAVTIAANITDQFVQFDYYREQLPPGTPATDTAAIIAAIRAEPAGTDPVAVMNAAAAGLGGATAVDESIPVYQGTVNQYRSWFNGVVRSMANHLIDALLGKLSPPRRMNVLRWRHMYHVRKWQDGTPAPGGGYAFATNTTSVHTTGFCRGDGQSFFRTDADENGTFIHEMGHALHLVHFAAGNFAWKHHDLRYEDCLMSYDYTHGYIPRPAGAVGTGLTADTGWPDAMPGTIPDGSPTPSNHVSGAPTIEIHTTTPTRFCAKCMLKLRGWNEVLLPCAFAHPDLF